MILYTPNGEKKRLFQELQVNGQEVNNDNDNETPTDYTADGDDSGGVDSGPSGNQDGEGAGGEGTDDPNAAPEDYTVPDDGGDNAPEGETGEEGNQQPPDDGGEGEQEPQQQGGDNGGGAEVAEGEGAPEDYTDDSNSDAQDIGPDNGESDDGTEGSGMEGDSMDQESVWDRQIQDLENQINQDLSADQLAIRNQELKKNYNKLYDAINSVIDRINNIPKDINMIKPIEFASDKLAELSDLVSDYLVYTFSTKTATENEVNYQLFFNALSDINSILTKLAEDKRKQQISNGGYDEDLDFV